MNPEYTTLSGTPVALDDCYVVQFDGAAVPNPGKAFGAAAILSEGDPRRVILKGGLYLSSATNNQAEYMGLLFGLNQAFQLGIKHLLIEGDSQLVVMQVSRKWNVRNESLARYHKSARELLTLFKYVGIRYIPRDKNALANSLASEGVRLEKSFIE
jgi:ribonuclease HI